jgi:hypothetical protein
LEVDCDSSLVLCSAVAIRFSAGRLLSATYIIEAPEGRTTEASDVFSGDNDGYLVNGTKIGAGKIGKGFPIRLYAT